MNTILISNTTGFITGLNNLNNQVTVNQVPCAYSYYKGNLDKKLIINSVFGYTSNKDNIQKLSNKMDKDYLNRKLVENENLVEDVLKELEVETNYPLYEAYLKQTLLDN